MGHATAKHRGGTLIGWECEFGHSHPSQSSAEGCNQDTFAVENRAKLDQAAQSRVRSIQDHPDYKKALVDAKALGAADDDTAEEVVLRNGIELVKNARAAVLALRIPVRKLSEPKQKDDPKQKGDPKDDPKKDDPSAQKTT